MSKQALRGKRTRSDWRSAKPSIDSPAHLSRDALVVWKIGGSVLTGVPAYREAAGAIAEARTGPPNERLVVVVSAESGCTDALLAEARTLCDPPDPEALDLLWSTGEQRSTARLVLALQALGVSSVGLNAHATGLRQTHFAAGDDRLSLNPLRIRAAAAERRVVIVPGFVARGAGDVIRTLGRGGSDLSAVQLAHGLGAARCELVKDVPGYFSADPKQYPGARRLSRLTWRQALAFADAGCDLVQRAALAFASDMRMPLVIRGLDPAGPRTRVSGVADTDTHADGWAALRDAALRLISESPDLLIAHQALFGGEGLLTRELPNGPLRQAFFDSPFHRAIADALNQRTIARGSDGLKYVNEADAA